jgi:two-component system, OmpR family, response regulator
MRILIVEDEPKLARLLARGLREEGHAADVAASGEEALWMAEAVPYDVIILDVMLPGIDGITVCLHLRAAGLTTPILMLTARDTVPDRVRGLDAGADDYLVKPFATDELLARLRSLARRPAGEPAVRSLQAHGLVLDLVRHEVTRDGEPITLTAKEFTLLEYFLRHPNQVVSRSQILAAVWGNESDVTSNVVDSYVHYLRNKVDDHHQRKLLHTVRGVGYVLRV